MKTEETNYNRLIYSWYKKSVVEDYFSKFIFLDLSFIALLRKRFFVFSKTDGEAIASLKKAEKIKLIYFDFLKRDRQIETTFEALIRELNKEPLKNVSRNNRESPSIQIKDKEDWDNLIEFIYTVRNNLFHGEKDPESFRDSTMVYYAYSLLKPLVEILISYEAYDLDVEDYDLKKMKEIIKDNWK